MGKSPGFWFFTGDWLKDAELRFCSLFARGLLVDLLCLMFEAKECGYLSKPDGTARDNAEIVAAISGGTTEEKLIALSELEQSGVLSRDNRGVLYSRRLARLAELSQIRKKAGSKGGSKQASKGEAKPKQTGKQNKGVTDTDTDTDSVNINKLNHPFFEDAEFSELLESFSRQSKSTHNWFPAPEVKEAWLYELSRHDIETAKSILRFSSSKGAKTPILNGDHNAKPSGSSKSPKQMEIVRD